MTGNLTRADPFESLDAMKARHKELLRTSEKEITVETVRGRVLEFLSRGTATGLVLDDPAERRVAQGLIDYWKATLYTQLRGDAEPAAPCPTTTVLADFPEDDSAKLVAAAEGAVSALAPEDRDVARRILQRLVRLEPAVREFHPVPVSRVALDEVGNVGQVVRVIHALEKAGVIRSSLAPTGEARVELTVAHLVRTWPRYADWLKDRLAFRAAAYLWQQRDRHSSGLVAGTPLAEAASYRDLDALEGEFLTSSRRRDAHVQRVRTRGVYAFFSLVIVGMAIIILLLVRAWNAEEEKMAADNRKREADKQVKNLEDTQKVINKRVTNINRMMRALSEIVVAVDDDEFELTKWRWEEMSKEVQEDDEELTAFLRAEESNINGLLAGATVDERGPKALAIAHALRNYCVKQNDERYMSMLASVRDVTFSTVTKVTQQLVDVASGSRNMVKDLSTYEREFWRLYWGPLGMVEGREVESAMYQFGEELKKWRKNRSSQKLPPATGESLRRTRANLLVAIEREKKQGIGVYSSEYQIPQSRQQRAPER